MGNCVGSTGTKDDWEVKEEVPLEKQLWPEMRTLLDKAPEKNEEKGPSSTTTTDHVGKEPKSLNKLMPRRPKERPIDGRDSIVCASTIELCLDEKANEEESDEWMSWPKNPISLDKSSNDVQDSEQKIKSTLRMDRNIQHVPQQSRDELNNSKSFKGDLRDKSIKQDHNNMNVKNNICESRQQISGEGCNSEVEMEKRVSLLSDEGTNRKSTKVDNKATMEACGRNTDHHPNLLSAIREEKRKLQSPEIATTENMKSSKVRHPTRTEDSGESSSENTKEHQEGRRLVNKSENLTRQRKQQPKRVSKHLNPDIAKMALSTLIVSQEGGGDNNEFFISTKKKGKQTNIGNKPTERKMSPKCEGVYRKDSCGLEPPGSYQPPRRTSL